jgi:deazaflavin-dependent oxidoreductase (nitroreductase family)
MKDVDEQRAIDEQLVAQFRADGRGTTGGTAGRPLLLLTTTGRRSGEPRTKPMMFVRQDDRLLVLASGDGAPEEPNWCRNLREDPRVTVEVAGEAYAATAAVLEGDERGAAWAHVLAGYPFFAEHQERAGREIPVVALTRTT